MKWNGAFAGALLAFSSLASAGPIQLPAVNPQCQRSPCLENAIEARRPGGVGGCKRFMSVTVIPGTVIQTSTTLVTRVHTVTDTVVDDVTTTSFTATTRRVKEHVTGTTMVTLAKRETGENQPMTISRTELPKHAASVCANDNEYASACMCVGHSRTTTTLAAPTSVTVVTKVVHETASVHATKKVTSVVSTVDAVATRTVVKKVAATEIAFPHPPCKVSSPFGLQVFVHDAHPDFAESNGTFSGRYGQSEMYFYLSTLQNKNAEQYIRDEQCSLAYANYIPEYHSGNNGTGNGTYIPPGNGTTNGTYTPPGNGTHTPPGNGTHLNGTHFNGTAHNVNGTYPASRAHVMNGTVATNQTLPARSRVLLEPNGAGRIVIDDQYGDGADQFIQLSCSSSSSSSCPTSPSSSSSSVSPSDSSASASSASSFSHKADPKLMPLVEFAFDGNQVLAKIKGLDFKDTKLQVSKDGGLFINPANFKHPDYADATLMMVSI